MILSERMANEHTALAEIDLQLLRSRMVHDLRRMGIRSEVVLEAMMEIPREAFVEERDQDLAYDEADLPVGWGQALVAPLQTAKILEAAGLDGSGKVLEVGTNAGYSAALLSQLCQEVVTIERIKELSAKAEKKLESLGIGNVQCTVGDGSLGWEQEAPYEAIVVNGAVPLIPPELINQLHRGGRLVVPVSGSWGQILRRITRKGKGQKEEDLGYCRFRPLVGPHAYKESTYVPR